MNKKAKAIQYSVRDVPPEVDRVLREKAARSNSTLGGKKRADFSDVVGHWTPDPAFDEIVASQRQIDPERWK